MLVNKLRWKARMANNVDPIAVSVEAAMRTRVPMEEAMPTHVHKPKEEPLPAPVRLPAPMPVPVTSGNGHVDQEQLLGLCRQLMERAGHTSVDEAALRRELDNLQA